MWVSSGSPMRTATARRAADPGGGDGAGHGLAGDLPDDGAEHAAAVERQAGQEVEGGDDEVGDHQPGKQDAGDGAGFDGCRRDVEDAGEDQREQRADEGQHEFAARGLGLLLDLGDAAEELELDPAHRELEAQGRDGVGQFVDEHGGVEGDREEEGDEVADGAELGQHAVELAAEDPGDQGGDEEPAGGDVDGHAEGPAHQDAAAGLSPGRCRGRRSRARCRGVRAPCAGRGRPLSPLSSTASPLRSGTPYAAVGSMYASAVSDALWPCTPRRACQWGAIGSASWGPAPRPRRPRPSARCRRRAPATSCSARCCTGSGSSTGCPRSRVRPRPAARWSTRCWSDSSTPPRPSGPRRGQGAGARQWDRLLESRPELAELFAASGGRAAGAVAGRGRAAGGALVHAGGPDPPGARRAGAVRRDGAGLGAEAARRSSTGSMWRPPARCGSWTTRRARRRGRSTPRARCSR